MKGNVKIGILKEEKQKEIGEELKQHSSETTEKEKTS